MPSLNLIYHPEAELEVGNAAEFYRARTPALARRFRDAFEAALVRLVEAPESFPVVYEHASGRRIRLHGFPYSIVYLIDPDAIYVVALAHERREPLYWLRRLEP